MPLSRMRFLALLGLLLSLAVPATAQTRVLLSVPLAGAPDAKTSVGAATAVGHHGGAGKTHWEVRGARDGISWFAPGNFDKARGTVAFFFRAAWKPGDRANRVLVCDDRNFDAKTDNAFRLWKWEDRSLRFDLRSEEDRHLNASQNTIGDGKWHHVAATWDCTVGLRLYVDGKRVADRPGTFTPLPARWLNLGHGQNQQPGLGDYRDLLVLDRMLDDEDAVRLAAGTLPLTPAPKGAAPAAAARPKPDNAPARETFRLDFEGSLNASVAANGGQPRQAKGVTFVKSPFGRAGYFGEGAVLEFAGEDNVPHRRGTLMLWVRPDWSSRDSLPDRFFFHEAPPDSPGDDCRWMWFHKNAGRLRFDLRTPGDPYVMASADTWRPGTWHHLAMTWDADEGLFTAYVDGTPVLTRGDSAKVFLHSPWEPKSKAHFWVGSKNGEGPALAAIDNLVIYDRALPAAQIAREATRVAPLAARIDNPHPAVTAKTLEVVVTNRSEAPVGNIRALITRGDKSQQVIPLPNLRLAAGASRPVKLAVANPRPGEECLIEFAGEGKQSGPSALARFAETPPGRASQPTERLIATIDLTAPLTAEQICDTGDCRVVTGAAGRYREASERKGSRFAVRLKFNKLGGWHRVEWTWPDDKPRTADVILNGGRYDVNSGTLSGDEYPCTGQMRTQSFYCWPRTLDDAVVFMTAEPGRPAAAASVKVYELSGPPAALRVPPVRFRNAAPRQVGLYYEDPVLSMNFGGSATFPSFAEVADRLVAYLEATGMNTLYYPASWYHGPLYPSASQGNAQSGSRPHPQDFIRYLLYRFEGRGLRLVTTFNTHDLTTLANVEIDEERVRAGAHTPISVLWNTSLKLTGWHGTPGSFNPLDPAVHGALRTMVKELAGRYSDSPAFGGICLHLPRQSLLWFGHLEGGYNDLNLRAFQKDTGIDLGLDWNDPLRANRAYRRLTAPDLRERWIDWRNGKLAAQWGEYAGILRAARPDLTLTANLYTVLDTPPERRGENPEDADYLGQAREYGADARLLARIPNMRLMNTFAPGLYRWERSRRGPAHPDHQPFRNACFSPSAYVPFARLGAPFGVNLHDKYWEDAIARQSPLEGMRAWGQREMGWRVSTPVPPAPHSIENYAEALGQADITTMTKGGFVVGTVGMEKEVAAWAAAFRQLPAVPFTDVPGMEDPVRARTCRRPDGEWAYCQNRLPEPVTVELRVSGAKELTDLATGKALAVTNGRVRLRLAPYQLVSLWAPAGTTRVLGGTVTDASASTQRLRARLQRIQSALPANDAHARGRCALATRLLSEGRLARAGHILEETWAAAALAAK